jgi:hypothetical protein
MNEKDYYISVKFTLLIFDRKNNGIYLKIKVFNRKNK